MPRSPRIPALLRQLGSTDPLALGAAVKSRRTDGLQARTKTADRVVKSICPYCAVGCGQDVYVKDDRVVHIEGDADSPVSRGRLCPRGSSSPSLVNQPGRVTDVLYRAPRATDWEVISLEQAMGMVADRVMAARDARWIAEDEDGNAVNHTLGFAHLGGATLDNEENYLIKKGFSALGAVAIENQARI